MMLHVSEATPSQARAAAAMKGYIADQKAVLVFHPSDDGPHHMMTFSLPMGPDDAHKQMVEAGVDFHTLEPVSEDETRVHVMAMDQATQDAVDKVARYDANRESLRGKGELLGEPEPGSKEAKSKKPKSGRQQRDEARQRYESIIQANLEEEDLETWGQLRDNWVSRFEGLPLQGVAEGSHPSKISAGVTTTFKAGLDSDEVYVPVSVETMGSGVEGERVLKANAELHAIPEMYLGMQAHEVEGDPNTVVRNVIERVKDNLRYLLGKATPAELAGREWYRAANAIIQSKAKQYGLDDASVAGLFAALSPTKDWDQNVHMAIRMLDIYHTKQDFAWTPEMDKTHKMVWFGKKPTDDKQQALNIQKKKLSELTDPKEIGMWMRTYDETYGDPSQPVVEKGTLLQEPAPWLNGIQHERGYKKFDPAQEGSFGDFARNSREEGRARRQDHLFLADQYVAGLRRQIDAIERQPPHHQRRHGRRAQGQEFLQ